MHHTAATQGLIEKLKPRLLNCVKGDNNKTLVVHGSVMSRLVTEHLDGNVEYGRVRASFQSRGVDTEQLRYHRRRR